MLIKRYYEDLNNYIKQNKVLIIYGPRQVGKTTLIENFLLKTSLKYKLDSGDNIRTQQVLSSLDFKTILDYVEGYGLLIIDEAQNIPHIGKALKIIVDQKKNLRVIATGSSSFNLSQSIGEPLTGRKTTLILYPIAQIELNFMYNKHELKENLNDFLIYGSYPEVIIKKNKKDKIETLNELVDSYLLKDVLALYNIKKSGVLLDLLKLLAFQIGSQVSFNELASNLKIDTKTVISYLDILERAFIIKKLGGFGKNLRSEITRSCKYYFLDLGIRNAIINQFNNTNLRNDIGGLWENFIFIERIKKLSYKKVNKNIYFWRTYAGNEIDFIEEQNNKLSAFETKWGIDTKSRIPKEWENAYKKSSFKIISPKNYLEYIL